MTERDGKCSDRFCNHLSFTFPLIALPPIQKWFHQSDLAKYPHVFPLSTLSMIDKQLLPFAFWPCVTFRKGALHVQDKSSGPSVHKLMAPTFASP